MCYRSILELFLFSSLVSAQFPSVNKSLICPPSTIDDANATGTGTFEAGDTVMFSNNNSYTNLSWAMTVDEGSQTGYNNVSFPTIDTSLWIGQPPNINLYDGSNGFSACAFSFGALPLNTIERGQSDDGSCYQTFSKACVTALTDQVANFAKWQTSSPTGGPYSNLTPPVLGYVCSNIQGAIGEFYRYGPVQQNAFPVECQPYFDPGEFGGPRTTSFEITSNTTDEFGGRCWVENSTSLPGYLLRQVSTSYVNRTGSAETNDALYNNATRNVIPILSVFIPPANNSRTKQISGAWADMTCLRTSKFGKGSRVSPELPSARPVHIPHSLGKGVEAGIAIAVIVGVALTAAAVWYHIRTKRRKARNAAAVNVQDRGLDDENGSAQLAGHEKYEIPGDNKYGSELGNGLLRPEAGGTPVAVTRAGTRDPEELEGQAHHHNESPTELQG